MNDDVNAALERANACPPGPWSVVTMNPLVTNDIERPDQSRATHQVIGRVRPDRVGGGSAVLLATPMRHVEDADSADAHAIAVFAAAAREDVPVLCETVATLHAALAEKDAEIERLRSAFCECPGPKEVGNRGRCVYCGEFIRDD